MQWVLSSIWQTLDGQLMRQCGVGPTSYQNQPRQPYQGYSIFLYRYFLPASRSSSHQRGMRQDRRCIFWQAWRRDFFQATCCQSVSGSHCRRDGGLKDLSLLTASQWSARRTLLCAGSCESWPAQLASPPAWLGVCWTPALSPKSWSEWGQCILLS